MIQTLISICTAPILGFVIWYLKLNIEDNRKSNCGIKLLLKSQLKQLHNEHMKNGYIRDEDMAEFNEIYTAYHELGGNGLATIWKNDIEKLERRG